MLFDVLCTYFIASCMRGLSEISMSRWKRGSRSVEVIKSSSWMNVGLKYGNIELYIMVYLMAQLSLLKQFLSRSYFDWFIKESNSLRISRTEYDENNSYSNVFRTSKIISLLSFYDITRWLSEQVPPESRFFYTFFSIPILLFE